MLGTASDSKMSSANSCLEVSGATYHVLYIVSHNVLVVICHIYVLHAYSLYMSLYGHNIYQQYLVFSLACSLPGPGLLTSFSLISQPPTKSGIQQHQLFSLLGTECLSCH